MFRVGFGYDVHRLVEGRPLVLGGVRIPWDRGLAGHSDADVLTHAVMDAILGALGRGDLGRHFPDTDERFRDADSLSLLGEVVRWMKEEGYGVHNLDATVVAQAPRLLPHFPAMQENYSRTLGVGPGAVNLKATTTEGLGFCGRGEGMSAYAVVGLVAGRIKD